MRKYFDSISHQQLLHLLERRFKDEKLLQLLTKIITAYRSEIGVGVPIGSLTSQHFANFYLGWLDRFVKEALRVRGYVRYMDDMVLWHSSREALVEMHGRCAEFASLQLELDFKPGAVQRTGVGVAFVGLSHLADSCRIESPKQTSVATACAGPGTSGASGADQRVEPAAASGGVDGVFAGSRGEELAISEFRVTTIGGE